MPIETSALDQMIHNLPSLSSVVNEFIALSKREYLTATDYEKIVSRDPVLVARLLKTANSAFFSPSRDVTTLSAAMVLVGLDNVKKIVYAVSSEGLLRREIKNYWYEGEGVWLHSMAVAVTCRALAGASTYGGLGGEEAFVAGLLHDIGKLAIDDYLDQTPGPRDVELEEEFETIGMDHAQLAGAILNNWEFPERIIEAIQYHHDPYEAGGLVPHAALVGMADSFCRTWRVGIDTVVDFGQEIDLNEWRDTMVVVGMNLGELAEVQEDLHTELENLGEIYSMT